MWVLQYCCVFSLTSSSQNYTLYQRFIVMRAAISITQASLADYAGLVTNTHQDASLLWRQHMQSWGPPPQDQKLPKDSQDEERAIIRFRMQRTRKTLIPLVGNNPTMQAVLDSDSALTLIVQDPSAYRNMGNQIAHPSRIHDSTAAHIIRTVASHEQEGWELILGYVKSI